MELSTLRYLRTQDAEFHNRSRNRNETYKALKYRTNGKAVYPAFSYARRAGACPQPGSLKLHQRDETMNLRFLRREFGQHPSEPLRLVAEARPHPGVAGGRRVAFVEDEIDDFEH